MTRSNKKIIHLAAFFGAIVCLSPIPFSDSIMLLPIQSLMITKLYRLHDKKLTKGLMKGIMTSMTVSVVGKSLAGNIIKLFPGIGTSLGIFINVIVAVALTEMIGLSVAEALEKNEIDNTNDLINVLGRATKLIVR